MGSQLEPVVRKLALNLLLFGVLENGAKLELQTTMFAIDRALMPRGTKVVNFEMLVPVLLSSMTATINIGTSILKWSELRKCQLCVAKPADHASYARWFGINCWLTVFAMAILVSTIVLFHCIIKFIMAHVCADSMWNISCGNSGCVDLHGTFGAQK